MFRDALASGRLGWIVWSEAAGDVHGTERARRAMEDKGRNEEKAKAPRPDPLLRQPTTNPTRAAPSGYSVLSTVVSFYVCFELLSSLSSNQHK